MTPLEKLKEGWKGHAEGPLDWQRFGDEWCLTGQYGNRPIVFSRDRKKGFRLRNAERDLLIPFAPSHPDARLLSLAWAIPRLVEALEGITNATEQQATWGLSQWQQSELDKARAALALLEETVKE